MLRAFGLLILHVIVLAPSVLAQDTTGIGDPLYDRPLVEAVSGNATALGGYVEGNTNYFSEDGLSEGFSMELRRFNVFLYSSISPRIKFLSELEFEHGTEEIALETALVDFELSPALVLRGGILLPPIGMFNQNHDSPQWDFVDRPLVSTLIIPSTLSEVGFGVHGRLTRGMFTFTYEADVVNGLGDGVILNSEGRTFLPAGKSEEMFEEDKNGSPATTGRISVGHRGLGEAGLSYYSGIYNQYLVEGTPVDQKRSLSIVALDFSMQVLRSTVQGEFVVSTIDIPPSLQEAFGDRQYGGFVDVVYPILETRVLGYDSAVLNAIVRIERVDFNLGRFTSTGQKRYDEVNALVLGASFRPTPGTVFKANYRNHRTRDVLGNPIFGGGLQFGLATYF